MCGSLWSLFHLIFEDCRFNTSFNLPRVQFPSSGAALIKPKDGAVILMLSKAETLKAGALNVRRAPREAGLTEDDITVN